MLTLVTKQQVDALAVHYCLGQVALHVLPSLSLSLGCANNIPAHAECFLKPRANTISAQVENTRSEILTSVYLNSPV